MKIDYYLLKAIKDNLIYLLTLVVLVVAFVLAVFIFVNQYQAISTKTQSLQKELVELNKKKELVQFKNAVIKDELDLDKINSLLTQLIPTKEDYFSIIATLEKLSQQTNFVVTGYNINVDTSTQEKLAITIEGQGDPTTFLEFLKNYNFGGGRLITIDKINFSTQEFTGTKVNISVYSGQGTGAQVFTQLSNQDRELVAKVLDKVQLDIKTEASDSAYPTKSNPF